MSPTRTVKLNGVVTTTPVFTGDASRVTAFADVAPTAVHVVLTAPAVPRSTKPVGTAPAATHHRNVPAPKPPDVTL